MTLEEELKEMTERWRQVKVEAFTADLKVGKLNEQIADSIVNEAKLRAGANGLKGQVKLLADAIALGVASACTAGCANASCGKAVEIIRVALDEYMKTPMHQSIREGK